MPYLQNLERVGIQFSDALSREESGETVIYIHVGGKYDTELKEALECIYFDNTRDFRLVDIKNNRNFLSAMVIMTPKKVPIKF